MLICSMDFCLCMIYTCFLCFNLKIFKIISCVDKNQQALKDPLLVPVRPITRARFKKIKEALNGPILT